MRRSSSFRLQCVLLVSVCLSGISVQALPVPATAPSASIEAIQQDFDAGKYRDAIKKSVQLLQLHGEAGKAIDKAKVLSIKAESHLRLKDNPLAITAWTDAAKESSDPQAVNVYRATALLIRKSAAGKYQPKPADSKSPKPEAIDVLELESRKKAMGALFTDESATVVAKVEALKKQKTLPPVLEGVKQVSDLRTLELAATDSDTTTKQMVTDLTNHAVGIIKEETKKMSESVESISRTANEAQPTVETTSTGVRRTVLRKRGLFSNDSSTLKEVISVCNNIVDSTEGLTKALGADAATFEEAKTTASKLATRADEVLKTDYRTPTYDSSGYQPRSNTTPPR